HQGAEAVRLAQGHLEHGDRAVGLPRLVEGDHLLVVHAVDVIAGEHHHEVNARVVEQKRQVLIHRVGGALVPVGVLAPQVGLEQANAALLAVQVPRAPDADVIVQRVRPVLRQHRHVVQPRVHAVAEREVDDAVLAGEGHGRLGPLHGENAEPLALATREDDRDGVPNTRHQASPFRSWRSLGDSHGRAPTASWRLLAHPLGWSIGSYGLRSNSAGSRPARSAWIASWMLRCMSARTNGWRGSRTGSLSAISTAAAMASFAACGRSVRRKMYAVSSSRRCKARRCGAVKTSRIAWANTRSARCSSDSGVRTSRDSAARRSSAAYFCTSRKPSTQC